MDTYTQSLLGVLAFTLLYLMTHYAVLPRAPIPVKVIFAIACAFQLVGWESASFAPYAMGVAAFVAVIVAAYPRRRLSALGCLAWALGWSVAVAMVAMLLPRWLRWGGLFARFGIVGTWMVALHVRGSRLGADSVEDN